MGDTPKAAGAMVILAVVALAVLNRGFRASVSVS
jgi:hypothetical protein